MSFLLMSFFRKGSTKIGRNKRFVTLTGVLFPCLLLLPLLAGGCGKKDGPSTLQPEEGTRRESAQSLHPEDEVLRDGGGKRLLRNGRLHINHLGGSLREVFNDSNVTQMAYAKGLGIDPITSLHKAFFTKRPVCEITSNEHYRVDTLSHSLPFLVPEAASLLDEIGAAFIDSLKARGGYGYRIKVTSLLRTPATVRALRRVNVNATDSSTHQYGTTFDISYAKFHVVDSTQRLQQEDLKNLLAEVLFDFRRRGRCLVKYERKSPCFHVTTTR